jgi:hypothetical protein
VTVRIRRFQAGDGDAIGRLNQRLRAGGATDVVYPEGHEQDPTRPVRERLFVAADAGEIRGGVWLKEQHFRLRGEEVAFGWLKYPVAESLVDARFSGVPASLLMQCLREQPRLLALGLGGHATPLARMLARLGWAGGSVPFYFRVTRPVRVLHELAPLRRTPLLRMASSVLASSGLPWLGLQLLDLARAAVGRGRWRRCEAEACGAFGDWADLVWERIRDAYGFVAVRDRAGLADMYPSSMPDIVRLRVHRGADDVGWAVVVRHDFAVGAPDRYFGRLTVGVLADALALPGDALAVAGTALEFLSDAGVDIVVGNQSHPAWTGALGTLGFLPGPSRFAFYRAPAAERLIASQAAGMHVNRGDCDGPIWYAPK